MDKSQTPPSSLEAEKQPLTLPASIPPWPASTSTHTRPKLNQDSDDQGQWGLQGQGCTWAQAGPDVVPCVQRWPWQTGPVHDFSWVLEPPFLVPGSPAFLLIPRRIPSSPSVRSGAPLLVLPRTTSLSVLSLFPHQTNSPQSREHAFVHFSASAPSPQPKKGFYFWMNV